MDELTLYVNVKRSQVVTKSHIVIKDAATVYCRNRNVAKQVEQLPLCDFHKDMDGREVITVLYVISLIQKEFPDLQVEVVGDPEFILFHKKEEPLTKKRKAVTYLKVVFVAIVAFFGAAFTIATFNNDVGVDEVFLKLYAQFTNETIEGPTILHLGYALGLPVGLFYFFNHTFHHRLSDEPTPLETQMRLYERDVNDSMVISSSRNKKTIDVKQ